MLDILDQLEYNALSTLEKVEDQDELEYWRVANLGRSSSLMGVFDQLGQLPKEERPAIGRRANQIKQSLEGINLNEGTDLRILAVLEFSDLVKFAKFKPLKNDVESNIEAIETIIHETKLVFENVEPSNGSAAEEPETVSEQQTELQKEETKIE